MTPELAILYLKRMRAGGDVPLTDSEDAVVSIAIESIRTCCTLRAVEGIVTIHDGLAVLEDGTEVRL